MSELQTLKIGRLRRWWWQALLVRDRLRHLIAELPKAGQAILFAVMLVDGLLWVVLAILLLSGCALPTAPTPECVVGQKANPYGYPGQPITVCVCPDGADLPMACQ